MASRRMVFLFVFLITPLWPTSANPLCSETKLTASDGATSDHFGLSVAISGDTVVVGAPSPFFGGLGSGSAYIFVRSGTTWTEQAKLTASDPDIDDHFGRSVAISGDTAVVGAPCNADAGWCSGSAYIFVRSGTTWTEQQKLNASDGQHGNNFGHSVAISGDTAAVGAWQDDDAGSLAGSAYIFVRRGTTWTEQSKLTASDAAAGDRFGVSIAISGDTAVVGAYHDDDAGSDSGSTYVYVRSGTTWSEEAKLTASDAAAGVFFGRSVAISGDTAAVGAASGRSLSDDAGSAYIFVRSGTTWTEQAKLTASDAAADGQFGVSIAISGDTAVVGAWHDDDAGTDSGSAYVYVRSGTTWSEQAKLTASDAERRDRFGISVAISGDTAVVGADCDNNVGGCSGAAYVYDSQTCTVTVSVASNRANFGPGQSFRAAIGVDNPGLSSNVDFYFGVLMPDGHTIVVFTDLAFNTATCDLSNLSACVPIVADVDLSAPFGVNEPSFFSYTWHGNEAQGIYTVFLAAVVPDGFADDHVGAGDIIALSTAPFTFTP